MNLDQIQTECFILSLFIRDDGQRFLLGSGAYEFKKSQQHFEANDYANDVIEVQGNDGVFLAGQVRRPSAQSFDGYIGDASVSKADIEQYRKDFLAFFRKNYYYTVVYIYPNGEAIQRRKGFIVDAPEVKELYQVFPEYHIALNFEDINYYSYAEDPDGQEAYTKSAKVFVSGGVTSGGLVWDSVGAVNTTGRNLLTFEALSGGTVANVTSSFDGSEIELNGTSDSNGHLVGPSSLGITLPAGTYTWSITTLGGSTSGNGAFAIYLRSAASISGNEIANRTNNSLNNPISFTLSQETTIYFHIYCNSPGRVFDNLQLGMQIETGSTATTYSPYVGESTQGFVWEEGSGGGPTTVMVDSIDRVYPIWEIKGPATNPQLAVLTSGTTISYAGTVSESQTLEIDMFSKTAKLNGVSVVGNITGDWIYFAPGNNRVIYTTQSADALPSTIYWQEIVG